MSDSPDTAKELRARALRLLARREHSRSELERKLSEGGTAPAALAAVLDAMEAKRQLSNERYAEERARQLARKYGAERVRRDLIARGVAGDVAERLSDAHGAEDVARARAILERKYRGPATTPQERAKRMRFLMGRGFSADVIRALLSSRDTG